MFKKKLKINFCTEYLRFTEYIIYLEIRSTGNQNIKK